MGWISSDAKFPSLKMFSISKGLTTCSDLKNSWMCVVKSRYRTRVFIFSQCLHIPPLFNLYHKGYKNFLSTAQCLVTWWTPFETERIEWLTSPCRQVYSAIYPNTCNWHNIPRFARDAFFQGSYGYFFMIPNTLYVS